MIITVSAFSIGTSLRNNIIQSNARGLPKMRQIKTTGVFNTCGLMRNLSSYKLQTGGVNKSEAANLTFTGFFLKLVIILPPSLKIVFYPVTIIYNGPGSVNDLRITVV